MNMNGKHNMYNYQNYFNIFNLTVQEILDSIMVHFEQKISLNVLNNENLEIEWTRNNSKYITTEDLSLIVLRYWLIYSDVIIEDSNVKLHHLYEEEKVIYEYILRNVFQISCAWKDPELSNENEDVMERRFNGVNKITERKVKDILLKNNKDDNENEFENYKINDNNFREKMEKNELQELIYNTVPDEWRYGMDRIHLSEKTVHEIFTKHMNLFYPEFKASHILVELNEYVGGPEFNFFKKLNIKFQKIIIKEIENYR